MKVDALVLAGGDVDKFAPELRPTAKGLLEIAGRPMVEYVLRALVDAKGVNRVVILAPSTAEPGAWMSTAEKVIYADDIITANIAKGIDYLGPGDRFLLVSSDIPLINGKAIDDFLERCAKIDAEVYYPIISREAAEARFPGTKRTYIKLIDGTFTGGNIFLLDKQAFINNQAMGEKIFAYRKSPVKMVQMLGIGFILKFIFRRLTIAELENKAGAILSCKTRAVVTDWAEIGVDVDKQEDLELFNRLLGSQA